MKITDSLRKRIEEVEGREEKCYMLDGVPHIAIGHNVISRALADETLEYLGVEDEGDLMHVTLTDDQMEYLLDRDLEIAIQDARDLIGVDEFDRLDQTRQEVLVDMSFNLGRPRFSKFKKLIKAVKDEDFEEAAAQILDSKAARNPLTSKRYSNLATEMQNGDGETLGDPTLLPTGEKSRKWTPPTKEQDAPVTQKDLAGLHEKLDNILDKLG